MTEFNAMMPHLPEGHWIIASAERLKVELDSNADDPLPVPPQNNFWSVRAPQELGLDPAIVESHRLLAEETGADSCLLVYKGQIVSEWTRGDFKLPVYAMSSTKSITNLLVGCLIDDGLLASIDVPVGRYLPDWNHGKRARVTLRHLLSHTSGLPKLQDASVGFEADKNAFVQQLEVVHEPGSTFAYSNEGVQLLSPILDVIAGEPIQDYARKRLFQPLGMHETKLQLDTEGHAWTYADMNTTPRDMARIGLMMLNGGMWEGNRIVSEDWIKQSTIPAQDFRADSGLLWWLHDDPNGFAALGYLHTDIHIFPFLDLVAVRTQSKPNADGRYPDYRERMLDLFRRLRAE